MHDQAAVESGPLLHPVNLLVFQATAFCNIDCSYCYLPERSRKGRMSPTVVATAVRRVLDADMAGEALSVVWHAGEPLAVGVDHLAALIEACAAFGTAGWRVQHCVQTNAVLIDDRFCRLFNERDVRVGVSLDGPARLHDRHRMTRAGRGTHAAVMNGIARLKAHAIPFDAICVLTSASLAEPEALYRYFAELGVRSLGFNVDEIEGVNRRSSMTEPDYFERLAGFWRRLVAVHLSRRSFRLREVDRMLAAIRDGGQGRRTSLVSLVGNITVGLDGALGVYCPELLGNRHPRFGDFSIGNVMTQSLTEMLAGARLREMRAEVEAGLRKCRDGCAYFDVCGGGAPSNKVFEHGTFNAAETRACRAIKQTLTDAILDVLRPVHVAA